MKKFLASICAAALLMTGCGGEQVADKPANNFSGEAVKLGTITKLNTDEKTFGETLDNFAESLGIKGTKHLPKFYDNLTAMQMGIEAGEIEAISTYNSVANYIVANNDKMEIVPNDALSKIQDSFCFAVRKDDTALKADLNKVIDEMKSDGSLDKLTKEYITDVDKTNPPKVEIAKIDGADTIKIGITGDLPPLDLILADGQPAGFNTAMFAEISKRLGKNVEVVNIESGARAAALEAKLIDVVFWVIVPISDKISADIDKPEGLELSEPYFQDNVAVIQLKK